MASRGPFHTIYFLILSYFQIQLAQLLINGSRLPFEDELDIDMDGFRNISNH